LADAGYDGEHVHEYAREERGVNTFIPAKIGRPTQKKLSGCRRRRMASRLHLSRYGRRWQVETVNSMLKRLMGFALRARSYHSQGRELRLRALTLNVLILRRGELFDRACLTPFFDPGKITIWIRSESTSLPNCAAERAGRFIHAGKRSHAAMATLRVHRSC